MREGLAQLVVVQIKQFARSLHSSQVEISATCHEMFCELSGLSTQLLGILYQNIFASKNISSSLNVILRSSKKIDNTL